MTLNNFVDEDQRVVIHPGSAHYEYEEYPSDPSVVFDDLAPTDGYPKPELTGPKYAVQGVTSSQMGFIQERVTPSKGRELAFVIPKLRHTHRIWSLSEPQFGTGPDNIEFFQGAFGISESILDRVAETYHHDPAWPSIHRIYFVEEDTRTVWEYSFEKFRTEAPFIPDDIKQGDDEQRSLNAVDALWYWRDHLVDTSPA